MLPGMDVNEAKQLVYDALLDCRVFVSNYYNGDAKGFTFFAENAHGSAQIGGTLSFEKNTQLTVRLPASAQVNFVKNGENLRSEEGKLINFEITEPGFYRVEVFREKRAWIYSNHIRIVGAEEELDS
jgi:hypothetical protein